MKVLVLALPFFALPWAALADDAPLPERMSLEGPCFQERQPLAQEERLRPEAGERPVMAYVYEHSELEAGVIYTDWGAKLRLDSHVGGYVRWGVEIAPNINVNLAFRYAEGGNSEVAPDENVLERALLAGVGVRVPLAAEFAATGNVSAGFVRFDSGTANVGNAVGPMFAIEAALTARLWEVLRFKAGISLDLVDTDFHRASSAWSLNLTYLVGFELGG
jgi:hypothetical protein